MSFKLRVGKIPNKDYRPFKGALEVVFKDAGFHAQDIGKFMDVMDRVGKDDFSTFLYMAGVLCNTEISDALWEKMYKLHNKKP